jgi:flagellar biosynthetic protein FlhB
MAAESEQEQNRSEQATPFKLDEARKRGLAAKSVELNAVAGTLAFAALLALAGQGLFERQLRLDASLLSQAHTLAFSESAAMRWLSASFLESIMLVAPVFALLLIVGIGASLLQTGPVFSFEPLKPDFSRINPAAGLKRLFSTRLLFEAAKNLLKLALFGYALYAILLDLMPLAVGLAQTHPGAYPRLGLEAVGALMLKLGLVMLAVALLDVGYVRREFAKKMMMSRREMRDEMKRREGDPKVKSRIRELQREMRKRSQALKRVPEADVLITNPTHVAVALRYRREELPAPQVIAKGAGELAARMKRLARRHGVPVVEDRPLARRLFLRGALDAPIPQAEYPRVAQVLAWVYALRDLRRERRA